MNQVTGEHQAGSAQTRAARDHRRLTGMVSITLEA